jgi:hypothetical protein
MRAVGSGAVELAPAGALDRQVCELLGLSGDDGEEAAA